MAEDPYGLISSGLPPEMAADSRKITRQQAIAQAMMQQAMQPMGGARDAGRFKVPPHWLEGVAKLAQTYAANQRMDRADQASAALGQRYQQGLADEVARITKIRQGQEGTVPDSGSSFEEVGAVPANPRGAIQSALLSQYPQVRQMGMLEHKTFENEQTRSADRDARLTERILTLEAAAQNQAVAAADRAAARAQAEALRRELQASQQQFASQQGEERRRFESDQRQREREHRRELAQDRIEARRQEKLDAARGKTDEAKQRVSVNLQSLSDYYDELTKLGASVDTSKSGARNVSARVRASGVGQVVAGALGTEEQSYRNRINQMRPLLLQEIRQASSMGARGLDSNKELEFYLQAATDPARDIQANRAALQVLENAYGLSSRVTGVSPESLEAIQKEAKTKTAAPAGQGGAGAPPAGVDPAVWNVMTPQERALWRK